MTNTNWESILNQLNDEFIEEAVLSYEQPVSAAPYEKETAMNHHARKTSKRLITIAVAAAMVMALAITGFATGVIPSLIGRLGDGYFANPDADRDAFYQMVGENSDKTKETVDTKTDMSISLTKEESYYDGEKVVVAYTLNTEDATVEFGFGPDDENFEKLFTPPEDNWTSMSQIWHDLGLSDADFVKAQATMRKEGAVGFTVRYVDIGDHVLLDDGTDLGPMTGGLVDGSVILENQNELPEQAKHLDEITVQLGVKQYVGYYYVKDDVVSYYYPVVEAEWVPFTVENVNHK